MMNRILLIDFYNTYIRNFLMVPVKTDDDQHFGAVFGFINNLKAAIDLINPTQVVVAMDGPKSALRRKMIYREYKANRRKSWERGSIRAYDFLSEHEQSDNFNFQVSRLKAYLSIFPVKTISLPFIEADDIIAEVCNISDSNDELVIYSTDSDYFQLLQKNRYCFNPIRKKLIGRDQFISKHGYLPENYIFSKCVMGDSSDNIPGIRSIGEKTFLKLFPEIMCDELKSISELIDKSKQIIDSGSKSYTQAQIKKYSMILENEEILQRNYNLMQLKNVDISLQSKMIISDMIKGSSNEYDKFKFRSMLIEDKVYRSVRYFEEWSSIFMALYRKELSRNEKN